MLGIWESCTEREKVVVVKEVRTVVVVGYLQRCQALKDFW